MLEFYMTCMGLAIACALVGYCNYVILKGLHSRGISALQNMYTVLVQDKL